MGDWREEIEAEISKINFLLENLYAVSMRDHDLSPADVDGVAEELCRQAALPGTQWGPERSPEEQMRQQERVVLRIAMFFAGVRKRLASS